MIKILKQLAFHRPKGSLKLIKSSPTAASQLVFKSSSCFVFQTGSLSSSHIGQSICSQYFSSNTKVRDFDSLQYIHQPEQGINRVLLVGRVGKDPQEMTAASNQSLRYVSFPLATTKTMKKVDSDSKLTVRTDWHQIIVGKANTQEFVLKHVNKGDRIILEGSLSYVSLPVDDGYIERCNIIAHAVYMGQKKKVNESESRNKEMNDSIVEEEL